jgi:uncharacterized protein YtpQ (UPF0354 family)
MVRLFAIRLVAILVFVCCAGGVMAESAPKDDPAARAYTEKVAAGLATKFPDRKFIVMGEFEIRRVDPGGVEVIMSTSNLYHDYKTDPSNLGTIVDLIAATLTDTEPPGARKLNGGRIVPVIKDRAWLEAARSTLEKGRDLLHEDYNDELVVVYGVDTASRTRYLMSDDDIGDRTDMRAHAVANLAALLPEVEMRNAENLSLISAGGDYEASLLLFNSIWRSGQIKVDGEIVVAIPAKDILMVTGSKNRKGIAAVRKLAAEYAAQSRYSITDTLFVYRNGQFVKYGRK